MLTIADLRRACALLLDEAERQHGAEFDLADAGHDYYWNVGLAAAFAMDRPPSPSVLDCGQTSDDAAEVAALLHGESPMVLWHDLEHAAGLLRLLARLDLPDVP
ncbi:MAG TPA: hypothetical protein VFX60_03635 [Micromonospora sp.]|nr:hypothetical protein [Micromonospora sp.]